ncbi:MAG: cystathionine gamma-synthase [Alphaproteobacteria bacterium]|nr:cystathionine gamma-synthase [Alphaproteobacteria bacterium]
MKFSTIAIHEAQEPDPVTGAVITPIYQTTTFAQHAPADMIAGYDYSRSGNPTRTVLEKVLAGLESGAHGFAFASGMGALTTLTMALLKAGDHVIVGDDVYGGTFRLFDKVLGRFGISASYVDMTDPANFRAAITPQTKMTVLETPTNPMLKIADLAALIKIAKEHNIITAVDNTFATPYLQKPLDLGADIALHSTTKYINGHSDVVGGALILKDDTYAAAIRFHQNALGATPDPLASWLTLRGLKTLAVRMEQHVRTAQALAEFLEGHEKVQEVFYPGLKSHPQHELAKRQMRGPGGMISLRLKGDAATTNKFLKNLRYFTLAESLGGIESLVEIPAVMTHASLTPENREKLGITDTLVRLSVGIEDLEDLREDLDGALKAAF